MLIGSCSQIWAGIKKDKEVFNKGNMWLVGRDSNLNFWCGNWTNKGLVSHLIQGPLTQEATHWKVKDVMLDSGQDWGCFPFDFPTKIKSIIQAIPFSITSRGSDRVAWVGNLRGSFDVKSAYKIAMDTISTTPFSAGQIWKVVTLPRMKTFLWRRALNSIGVKVCLARRGVVDEDACLIYHGGSE